MTLPGIRLRAIAARFCSRQTLEHVVDPLIADLQIEYAQANLDGRPWRARSLCLAAAVSLSKVIVVCGSRSFVSLRSETTGERPALIRVVAFSLAFIAAAVVLFVTPPWRMIPPGAPHQARLLVNLIPQAVAVAIPIGLMIGILFGLRGRTLSSYSTRVIVATAAVLSLASFVNLVWLMPAANQSFRESMAATYAGKPVRLPKGANEMTLRELRGEIDSYKGTVLEQSGVARSLEFSYHQRWSLAFATGVLALFALGVLARRPTRDGRSD